MLANHWADYPPTHILLAGFLGVLPDPNKPTWENEDVDSLFARWGGTEGTAVVQCDHSAVK